MSRTFVLLAILLVGLFSISYVEAHGYMSFPLPRGQYMDPKKQPYEEYDPAAVNYTNTPDMVCRGHPAIPDKSKWLSLTAGGSQPITLDFNAFHPGDCFMYLTYDGDKPENQMKWFKIWQQHDCSPREKGTGVKHYSVPLPNYLPSGSHVIMRWEWYALHQLPNGFLEFYVSCVDATVTGIASGTLPLPQVNIPGINPFWLPGKEKISAYPNPYYDDGATWWFVGPQLATKDGKPAPTTASGGSLPTSSKSSSSTSSKSTTASSSNPGCTIGSLNCACTGGGTCNSGLTCDPDNVCIKAAVCTGDVGAIYCACTVGGACDNGLTCYQNKTCVDEAALKNSSGSLNIACLALLFSALLATYFL